MDGSRFDAWTRRRFGVLAAAGGFAGSLIALIHEDAETTKRRKRKKRCTKQGKGCKPGGKRKCCQNLRCRETINGVVAYHCCRDIGGSCSSPGDCCSGFCLDDQCQPALCKEIGDPCNADDLCCSNNCFQFDCAPPD